MSQEADDEQIAQILHWLQRSKQEIHVGRGGIWLRPARPKRPRTPPWRAGRSKPYWEARELVRAAWDEMGKSRG